MASGSTEDKLAYVLTVLKNTELPQPDYHAVAKEAGVNNANNAQKKFKAIVESGGFKLVNKQVVSKDDDSAPSTPTSTSTKKAIVTPKMSAKKNSTPKSAAKTASGGRGKKRKIEEVISSDEEEDKVKAEDDSDMVDVTRTGGARSPTVKAEEIVVDEVGVEEV